MGVILWALCGKLVQNVSCDYGNNLIWDHIYFVTWFLVLGSLHLYKVLNYD